MSDVRVSSDEIEVGLCENCPQSQAQCRKLRECDLCSLLRGRGQGLRWAANNKACRVVQSISDTCVNVQEKGRAHGLSCNSARTGQANIPDHRRQHQRFKALSDGEPGTPWAGVLRPPCDVDNVQGYREDPGLESAGQSAHTPQMEAKRTCVYSRSSGPQKEPCNKRLNNPLQ